MRIEDLYIGQQVIGRDSLLSYIVIRIMEHSCWLKTNNEFARISKGIKPESLLPMDAESVCVRMSRDTAVDLKTIVSRCDEDALPKVRAQLSIQLNKESK